MEGITSSILKNKYTFIIVVTILIGLHLLWEYYSYGHVITHYLLADDNLPGISNYWELLTIPFISWAVLTFLQRELKKAETVRPLAYRSIAKGFLSALLFGLSAALMWEFDMENILQFYILLPVLLALFFPVYRPEYFLGFLLGMTFTFGGVLPVAFGGILALLSFLVHKVIRRAAIWAFNKLNIKK
jgi:hypothetical protein